MSEPSEIPHRGLTLPGGLLRRPGYGGNVAADPTPTTLACSHGYLVVGCDGPLGVVETPLFPPGGDEPDYLVLRRRKRLRASHPVVHVSLVHSAEPGLVRLAATADEVDRLPEGLPLAI